MPASPSRAGRAITSRRSYHKGESQYAYALQVLARLLGGGETSRLWKALVADRKVALSAWASYSPSSLGLTSFDLGVHPASGTPIVEIESAVGGLLGKLIDDGVGAEEVERAQNQLLAGAIYSPGFAAERPAHLRHALLGIGGTRRRHRRLAAAHRRGHAGRRRCRRAPRLARRRARHLGADAAGRHAVSRLLRILAALVVAVLRCCRPPPARSTSRT